MSQESREKRERIGESKEAIWTRDNRQIIHTRATGELAFWGPEVQLSRVPGPAPQPQLLRDPKASSRLPILFLRAPLGTSFFGHVLLFQGIVHLPTVSLQPHIFSPTLSHPFRQLHFLLNPCADGLRLRGYKLGKVPLALLLIFLCSPVYSRWEGYISSVP
ncbi:hypothetical protein BDV41DRAFT_488569 [Aspergillus transmontanensis]|uniref:Uncharacterized protein n=1 Tax=Aspergillus transmontanensis TaxID=1034304 RepID=A0A5N6VJU9_9EURO|nr:hypothetical protein BDV41DRAFT_488569 [Aspergillus transmontanensis]